METDPKAALDAHRLQPLLSPRSVAIVGASSRVDSFGLSAVRVFLAREFTGRVFAVNPGYTEVEGLPCFASLNALPEVPDLAVLCIANERIEEQLKACAQLGIRAAAIFGSTYLADDDPIRPLLVRLREIARSAGMQVCGSNCMGFYNVRDNVHVSINASSDRLKPGPVAFISHSGTAWGEMVDTDGRVALSFAVSAGQEIATTAADYLDYALTIPSTRCVAMFLETIRDTNGFIQGLERARVLGVPVVILKVGRSQEAARLAVSHSGAMVGDDDAYRALFKRHRVVQVETMGEMVNAIQLFSVGKPLSPGGLAAILDSGGRRELLLDLADELDVPFAKISEHTSAILKAHIEPGLEPINPLDFWGSGIDWHNRFCTNAAALADDPDTALCVFSGILTWSGVDTYTDLMIDAAKLTDQPLGVQTDFIRTADVEPISRLNAAGIPVLHGEHSALRAIRAVMNYRDALSQPSTQPPLPPPGVGARWRERLRTPSPLNEVETTKLFSDYGIATLAVRLVDDLRGALDAANELGYPVVLKTATGIDHKTDVDGVKLGLNSPAALETAYADLASRLGPCVAVSPHLSAAGVELELGVLHDPVAGMILMIGAGGTLVELLDDKQCALAPSTDTEIRACIDALRIRKLLGAVRGRAPLNVDALVNTALCLSVLAGDLKDVLAEADVNPVKVTADGCVALDTLVRAKSLGH